MAMRTPCVLPLTGVGHRDLVDLIGVQPDLPGADLHPTCPKIHNSDPCMSMRAHSPRLVTNSSRKDDQSYPSYRRTFSTEAASLFCSLRDTMVLREARKT